MIHIVDDEEPLRDSLAWLLRSRDLPCRAFASAEDYLAYLQAADTDPGMPAAILLDVRMGGLSGTELFERLRAEDICPAWPVVFLTGHGDVPMAVQALKDGAFDFIEKPYDDNALVDKVLAAIGHDAKRCAHANAIRALRQKLEQLTQREQEVMQMILAGKLNKVIADDLGIAMRTVEVHRSHIFEKMQVRSAVELSQLLSTLGG